MKLSDRVKLARTKRGISQRGLAARIKVSTGYISQLENTGEGAKIEEPGLAILKRLALALDVPLLWLAYGEGKPRWSRRETAA